MCGKCTIKHNRHNRHNNIFNLPNLDIYCGHKNGLKKGTITGTIKSNQRSFTRHNRGTITGTIKSKIGSFTRHK